MLRRENRSADNLYHCLTEGKSDSYLVCLWVLFIPLYIWVKGVVWSLSDSVLILLIVLWGLQLSMRRKAVDLLHIRVLMPLLLLIYALAFAAIRGINSHQNWGIVYNSVLVDYGAIIFYGLGCLVVSSCLRDFNDYLRVLRAYILAAVISSLLGFIVYRNSIMVERFRGFMNNPNAWGFYISTALIISLNLIICTAKSSRTALLLCTAVLALSLIFTCSNGAFLGTLMGVCVSFLMNLYIGWTERRSAIILKNAIVITILCMIVSLAVVKGGLTRQLRAQTIGRIMDREVHNPKLGTSRVVQASKALSEVSESTMNLLFGIGLGSYRYKHKVIIHNTPLWIFVESGLFGLIFLIAFVVSLVVICLRSAKAFCLMGNHKGQAISVALIGCIVSLIPYSLTHEAFAHRAFWFVSFSVYALYILTTRELSCEP